MATTSPLRQRMIEDIKGRCAMLSPRLLDILRAYWRHARPGLWLFPDREAAIMLASVNGARKFPSLAGAAISWRCDRRL